MMQIRFAIHKDIVQVISLFEENLSRDNDAIYSEEFFCPLGAKAAIRRNQVIIATQNNVVIAALRFYRRKTQKIISLYQFAIAMPYRGQGVLLDMLDLIRDTDILVLCPKISSFNAYYKKTGWTLKESDKSYNHWFLPSKSIQDNR